RRWNALRASCERAASRVVAGVALGGAVTIGGAAVAPVVAARGQALESCPTLSVARTRGGEHRRGTRGCRRCGWSGRRRRWGGRIGGSAILAIRWHRLGEHGFVLAATGDTCNK